MTTSGYWLAGSQDNVQSGEADAVLRPKLPTQYGTKRGVLYVHGREAANGGCYEWQNFSPRNQIVSALAKEGYVTLTADLGGNTTWANNTVLSRLDAACTYLLTLGVSATKIALIGQSMGALNLLAWAKSNLSKVTCAVCMIPVVDLTDVHTNNRGGFQSEINTAYGGTYSEASFGAAHNPATMAAAGSFGSLPIQLWYGDSDTTAIPSAVTTFASNVGASATANAMSGGHTESILSQVSISSVLSFIAAAG